MKYTFFKKQLILALSGSFGLFAQNLKVEGHWYTELPKRDGNKSQITLSVHKASQGYTAFFIDPKDQVQKKYNASEVSLENDKLFIAFDSLQLAFDVSIKENTEELIGFIIQGSKSTPILLSKKQASVVAPPSTPAPKSVYESGMSPDYNTPRPIESSKSLFIEELTWMEVRDAQKAGKNSVIIATGGVEQSGPYIPTGKHNFILKSVTQVLAQKLGNALVAPIIPFVPEGDHDPVSGHLKYPGSISLTEATYELLLKDILTSYKVEGFKYLILIGDSGGNQWGMYRVARQLNKLWAKQGIQVLYIPEYYDNTRISKWLKEQQGIEEGNEGIHDSFKVTAQIAVLDPKLIHAEERIAAGKFSINGVNLAPLEKTIELGKKIIDYQTDLTIEAIKRKLVVSR